MKTQIEINGTLANW